MAGEANMPYQAYEPMKMKKKTQSDKDNNRFSKILQEIQYGKRGPATAGSVEVRTVERF